MVGDRIRRYRRKLGKNQEWLAERVGISQPYVSLLEKGSRPIDDRDLLYRIAHALKVSVQTLTGEPYPTTDPELEPFQRAIPAIESALVGAGEYDQDLPEPLPMRTLLADVNKALMLRMAGEYGPLGTLLPGLIRDLYRGAANEDNDVYWRGLAEAAICASLAVKAQGYVSLGLIAAETANIAASSFGSVALCAGADFARAQALVAAGARRKSLDFSTTRHYRPGLTADVEGQQMAGMLHLQSALVHASLRNEQDSMAHLAEATILAGHTQEGSVLQLMFGPANVCVWSMSAAAELRDGGRVLALAQQVDPRAITTADRKSRYYIELARGHYMEEQYGEAVGNLLVAERISPHLVRTRTVVREMVGQIQRREKRAWEESPLGQFAKRLAVTEADPSD